MGKLLVALDGSPRSLEALRWASSLAERMTMATTAVAVWGPKAQISFEASQSLDSEFVGANVRSAVRGFIADAGLADIDVEAVHGTVAHSLHDVCDSPEVVALVLGTRGLGTIPGLLLGSVTRRLLFDSPSPLILVPSPPPGGFPPVDEVVVAVDGSAVSAPVAAWSAHLCRRLGARATVLRCVDPGAELPDGHVDQYLEELRSLVEERWCAPFAELEVEHRAVTATGDPRNTILESAGQAGAGLVVVAGRGAGQFQGLGGTTSYLVRHSSLPLAVIPSDEGWKPSGF